MILIALCIRKVMEALQPGGGGDIINGTIIHQLAILVCDTDDETRLECELMAGILHHHSKVDEQQGIVGVNNVVIHDRLRLASDTVIAQTDGLRLSIRDEFQPVAGMGIIPLFFIQMMSFRIDS